MYGRFWVFTEARNSPSAFSAVARVTRRAAVADDSVFPAFLIDQEPFQQAQPVQP